MAVARDLQGAIDLAARLLEEMGVREPPVPDSFNYFVDPSRPVHVSLEPLSRRTRGASTSPAAPGWRSGGTAWVSSTSARWQTTSRATCSSLRPGEPHSLHCPLRPQHTTPPMHSRPEGCSRAHFG